jgi:hypothetical protein
MVGLTGDIYLPVGLSLDVLTLRRCRYARS